MSRRINILIKEPNDNPQLIKIPNRLSSLQLVVGGYIETVTIASDLVIICNEEGRIKDLPYNCSICGVDFYGTIILCGFDGEEFADVPMRYDQAKRLFPALWEVNENV